jgi:aldose 1-epimerase
MEVFSDMPGLQAYSGNFINDAFGRNGEPYHSHSGIALETQFYPNAINIPSFPQPLIAKDEKVFHRTAYRFSV